MGIFEGFFFVRLLGNGKNQFIRKKSKVLQNLPKALFINIIAFIIVLMIIRFLPIFVPKVGWRARPPRCAP